MAQHNPYTPGQVPHHLAGRRSELDQLTQRLDHVETFGELGGPLVTFHAPRGLGKTSLLRSAYDDAAARGFLPVWVAAAQGGLLLPEISRAVVRAVDTNDALAQAPRRWRARLEKVQVELGVPGAAKVGAQIDTRPARDDAEDGASSLAGPAPIGAVEDLLGDTARLARERGGAGLALFVDEVHAAPRRDLAVLLNALQHLDGERSRNPLTVLTAGLPSTPGTLTRAATFGERTTFLPLAPLNEVESANALTGPAGDLEVIWSADALRVVIETAAGLPYYLQLLAWSVWDSARPRPGSTIGVEDVEHGTGAARTQLTATFEARWSAATPLEQDLIVAVLAEMAATRSWQVSRAAIAARMDRETRSLSSPRDRLIDKGILESAGRGALRFALPGFASHLARTLEIDDEVDLSGLPGVDGIARLP